MSRPRAATLAVLAVLAGTLDARAEDALADEDAVTEPTEEEAEPSRRRLQWYVVPNLAYDTDDGLGFGLRGELAIPEDGFEPYREAYVLHGFGSLRGYQHHRFRFDRTGLGPGRRFRVTLHAAYRQWENDGYWGIGNGTTREREHVGSFDEEDPRRTRYRYSLIQPFVHLTFRADMGRPWSLFCSLNGKWTIVGEYEGSLLSEHRPHGMDGGPTVLLAAGLLYDTRDPEVDPQRGVFAELSGQWALPLPWGPGGFAGLFASVRVYRALFPWLVLAGRVMLEMLSGRVPFYEMVHWRGAVPMTGFGGFETVRGIPFGRWRAPAKAVANLEARIRLHEQTLFRRSLVWQLALFSDAGVVFNAGEEATAPPPAMPLHVTAGLGLRVVFAGSFVARLDTALGRDPVTEPGGRVTDEVSWGLYLVFDQAF